MKLSTIKIKDHKIPYKGFILFQNKQWVAILNNPTDYQLDEVLLLSKKYITRIWIEKEDRLLTQILLKKYSAHIDSIAKKVNSEAIGADIFNTLLKTETLFSIQQKDSSMSYLGIIQKLTEKGFYLLLLSHKITWLREFFFRKDSVRVLSVSSDYLSSMKIGLQIKKGHS